MGRDIKNAEIFAVGTWNNSTFSEQDLDNIVEAFNFFQMSGQVPLKFGHNDTQPVTDGQPALGWVDRVWRDGKKLFADFRDVPSVVYDSIKSGLYKFVSVELLRNVTAGTRQVPLVLDAVALLGADPPAVGTLRDLQVLTMSAFRQNCEARLAFTRSINIGDTKTMADDNELEQLKAQLEAAKRAEAEAKALAASNAERFTRLDTETKQARTEAHRKEVTRMLEDAVRDKRMLPAARERFLRFFKIDTDAVNDVRIPDVEAYIRENPNPYVKQTAVGGGGGADPDAIPVGGMPDVELMARARKLCRDRGKDPSNWQELQAATIAVMRANPALAEKYRALPDDHADGKYEAA